jgi:hypothetical protein
MENAMVRHVEMLTKKDGQPLVLFGKPGNPLPFRIQTVSLKVLNLKFKVLDEINKRYKPEKSFHFNN